MAKSLKSFRVLIVLIVVLLIIFAAFLMGRNINRNIGLVETVPPKTGTFPSTAQESSPVLEATPTPGLTILLSDGKSQPQPVVTLPVQLGEPLSLEDINNILLRLPPLATSPDDWQAFKLPEEVLPPPRTGQTISEPFPLPPEETAPEVAQGPLEVLRYSPEGNVPIAPFVNVTFNQPMVPLATLQELSNQELPVQIEPSVPGTWRWLGTKTLNFQFDSEVIDRMPMATEYTVTIPAGTTSATGGKLAETVQFTFRTPPPTVQQTYPYSGEPQPLDPLFFISFDQRIDPGAVLETIKVEAEGVPVKSQTGHGR